MFKRYDLKTDILLALMPTATIIAVLLLLDAFGKQHFLFASLASSAFLIYLDPKHPTNSIRTLLIAQVSASLIGYGVYKIMGPGYPSAAVSMVISIGVMIGAKAMHPPAVSTAMTFAFQDGTAHTLLMFGLALMLLAVLVALQHTSLWLIKRFEKRNPVTPIDTKVAATTAEK